MQEAEIDIGRLKEATAGVKAGRHLQSADLCYWTRCQLSLLFSVCSRK